MYVILSGEMVGTLWMCLRYMQKESNVAMFQLTVLYGHPENVEEFDRYYSEVHTPLVQKIQGLKGLSVTKFTTGPRDEQPPYYQMAAMYADTREQFDALMSTPEGKAVGRDVRNFATGGATLIYGDEQKYI